MVQVCPIVLVEGVLKIPSKFEAIMPSAEPYSISRDGIPVHLEEVETVGDIMDQMGVVGDYSDELRNRFIIWKHEETNVFCGGEVVLAIGIAKPRVTYGLQEYRANRAYISRQNDGKLILAFPA